jgi:DNA-binding protein HU-beta
LEVDLNKSQLVAQLATRTGLTKARCAEVVDAMFGTEDQGGIIPSALLSGQKVVITGFGTFGIRVRAERTGTNPASGARIRIPSKNRAYFRVGKALKARLGQ